MLQNKTPVFILNTQAEREHGRKAQLSNITAGKVSIRKPLFDNQYKFILAFPSILELFSIIISNISESFNVF